jgi:hypothetical protein
MKMRVGSNQIKSEYRVVSDAIEALYQLLPNFTRGLPVFEIALVLVGFDHIVRVIVNANHLQNSKTGRATKRTYSFSTSRRD